MSRALISTLHSGIEIAFLIALLSACSSLKREDSDGQRGLFSPLKWGAILGIIVSLGLTYGAASGWDREAIELTLNGLAVALTLGLIAWLGASINGVSVKIGGLRIFLTTTVLLVIPGLDIGLTQTKVFLGSEGLVTELAGGLLVLTAAGLAGLMLYKVSVQARPRWVILATILVFSILLLRDTTTALQIMMVKGMIPLTDWLFQLIVPLVNNFAAFFYAFMTAATALVLTSVWEWRQHKCALDGLNPAQKRKTRVIARRTETLFASFGLLLLLFILGDGASAFLANRPPQLSAATPVSAENGQVRIPGELIVDGQLHRFSFAAEDNITVRFLMIYKGSGIYGVGLDACEFCGVAGYRQEKGNVICNRCNAAINKTSIGFPGGCNPIPLPYDKEGDFVAITIEELEALKGGFAR